MQKRWVAYQKKRRNKQNTQVQEIQAMEGKV